MFKSSNSLEGVNFLEQVEQNTEETFIFLGSGSGVDSDGVGSGSGFFIFIGGIFFFLFFFFFFLGFSFFGGVSSFVGSGVFVFGFGFGFGSLIIGFIFIFWPASMFMNSNYFCIISSFTFIYSFRWLFIKLILYRLGTIISHRYWG